jgi:hypothetical protein
MDSAVCTPHTHGFRFFKHILENSVLVLSEGGVQLRWNGCDAVLNLSVRMQHGNFDLLFFHGRSLGLDS